MTDLKWLGFERRKTPVKAMTRDNTEVRVNRKDQNLLLVESKVYQQGTQRDIGKCYAQSGYMLPLFPGDGTCCHSVKYYKF